ncbi:helicase C-terminal domain-containing protein [Branchiibius sp. NY16-3462-2]|uniref:ATP-dependent DNA helicase n=1 Tax=Branchiibius sp. NY16-3462-2 TaxID=1807500 RepID=UPI0007965C43|nr:helicase C-terminal domain-containing protein [Branchiibius sp. NY16-3462-2]KYH43875.1 hypothetical protein AZH51_15695 [Branchiibius sp. NY16-3462-2]
MSSQTPQELHALLDDVLCASVRRITGGAADKPRTGQADLAHRILDSMLAATDVSMHGPKQVAALAPTGSGKSLSGLAPALLIAAVRGERTVISTESLSLQAQIVDKDAPVVATAVAYVLGLNAAQAPKTAVLKGWGNYSCGARTAATLADLTGFSATGPDDLDRALPGLARLSSVAASSTGKVGAKIGQAAMAGRTPIPRRTPGGKAAFVEVDGREYDAPAAIEALRFACGEGPEPLEHRDVHHVETAPDVWPLVSTTTDACEGAAKCPFGSACAPTKAREHLADASVIVTNHKLLAIQAATGAPVVIGSKKIGPVDHLMVDECHALANIVRDTGAVTISGSRISGLARRVGKLLVDAGTVVDDGRAVADQVDVALASAVFEHRSASNRSAVTRLGENDDPLSGVAESILAWVGAARKALPSPATISDYATGIKVRGLLANLGSLASEVGDARTHVPGVARWLETDPMMALKTSPVDVAAMIRYNLFSADVPADGDPADFDPESFDDQEIGDGHLRVGVDGRYELSVTMMSATLPIRFAPSVGMTVQPVEYPSPFGAGHGNSALFIPQIAPGDEAALSPFGRFDTGSHPAWAAAMMTELVQANDGSALILAATTTAGKFYADALRKALRRSGSDIEVLSQWDGPPVRILLQRWRSDHRSVMIGTRSLMTGVDAPGQTCTLVVIDRVPRAAGNPVDDARVEQIRAGAMLDRWSADRLVYVADARLLLAQAAGRLHRSSSDTGMIAVLDPRLLRNNKFSYPEPTRKMLIGAVEHMGHKLSTLTQATGWLGTHRAAGARVTAVN